ILATSTQPLRAPDEQVYAVPPLAVPPPPATWDAEALAALQSSEAANLFLQRAREAFPDFQLTPQNAAAVLSICERLDGMPVAIELEEARVKLLAPAQIADRLGDALALLPRGRGEAPPRHQALRATLDWTYRLLSLPEQVLLRRLSIFAGSFDLAMAEA